ncbi:MAG: molybdopterin molybdenumtransferase MoeA [Planctomycetota bacterium]|nr:MAG: molybdopterin molybdenumtransferase MoeA [Planctomycetota bacterium]
MKEGFGRLLSLKEALQLLLDAVGPMTETEEVALGEALGRVVAEDVRAVVDVPHFSRAAMDGYAVVAEDTFPASPTNPVKLKLLGSVEPGVVPDVVVERGSCVRVSTGAALPRGADAVVMVESTQGSNGEVIVFSAVAPGANVVRRGSDLKRGDVVVPARTVLYPEKIGALAASGIPQVRVLRKPKFGVLSTGPELLDVGDEPRAGCVYDINSHTLCCAVRQFCCEALPLGKVTDDAAALKRSLLSGIQRCDVLLLSGGSSLGEGDLVPQIIKAAGRLLFHGIAVKPGKPTAAGIVSERLVIGLPGYPTSALSNFYIVVLPVIERLLGVKFARQKVPARLAQKVFSTVGRYEFLPVRLEGGKALPLLRGSSAITSLALADGFVEIDENTEVLGADDVVEVTLFPRGVVCN